eukprot:TRINITY_DN7821_c0_g1_i1.p1 TRINITY_DN7821_c0_g1~~TRINITY_DN7821_c0_g1_i1.p1  ORF type:complete len:542 (-),score=75.08 TRINITY_DN7821_c0_g1_i1:22-1647(-)
MTDSALAGTVLDSGIKCCVQYFWEWMSDVGWVRYDVKTSRIIEKNFRNGEANCALQHGYFARVGGYKVDFIGFQQIKVSTGYSRPVRRLPDVQVRDTFPVQKNSIPIAEKPKTENLLDMVDWEWQADTGWQAYDKKTTRILEKNFNKNPNNILTLTHSFFGQGGGYSIDFSALLQIRDATGFARKIRRVVHINHDAVWERLEEDTKNWIRYDKTITRLLEGSLVYGRRQVAFVQDGVNVEIDFAKMIEKRGDTKVTIRRTPQVDITSFKKKHTQEIEHKESDGAGFGTTTKDLLEEFREITNYKTMQYSELNQKRGKKRKRGDDGQAAENAESEDFSCSICLCLFSDENEDAMETGQEEHDQIVLLQKCQGHYYHLNCIIHCFKNGFLQCPCCNAVYGVRIGTMPEGTMRVKRLPESELALGGYEGHCGTIVIIYSFPDGIQGDNDTCPGKPYTGTERVAYLPDNAEGSNILELLQVAWKRKLLFRIGTSVTTGREDCVIWNGIHHKTNTHGGSTNFGYPDPDYFARVEQELKDKGVTLTD